MRKTVLLSFLILLIVLAPGCSGSSNSTAAPDPTNSDNPVPVPAPKPRGGSSTSSNPAPAGTSGTDGTATLTGSPALPDLEIDAGNVTQVVLYDLVWNEIASDGDVNPDYRFLVDTGSNYIVIADYESGQSIGAITPTVTGDMTQDIDIDTEVAMSLVIATEQAFENLLPESLSRPLDDLIADADTAVVNLNAFYKDRNTNRSADRIADAVHSITMDFLNKSQMVYVDYLAENTIRAYGGGLDGVRSLAKIVSDPMPPLNPHFVFTRYNQSNEVDFGMSDLDTKRWDFMGANGMTPHIVTGGDRICFTKPTSTWITAFQENVIGLWVRDLGTSPNDADLVTPWNMECWTPSWSPDQSKIAFAGRYIEDPSAIRLAWDALNIYVIDVQTRELTQITFNPGRGADRLAGSLNPAWSPDGELLVFDYAYGNVENSRLELVMVSDPDSRTILLPGGTAGIWEPGIARFSPDGSQIVFSANVEDSGDWDLEVIAIPSDYGFNGGEIVLLTENSWDDTRPDWSFDGRFVMFSSNRGGESGKSTDGYLYPFYVISAYTGDVAANLGDFANAGTYFGARFCGTEAVLAAVSGTAKNSSGEAVISGSDKRTSSTSNSDYSYYRETIPAANNIVDAYGSPAYNYGVTSWW